MPAGKRPLETRSLGEVQTETTKGGSSAAGGGWLPSKALRTSAPEIGRQSIDEIALPWSLCSGDGMSLKGSLSAEVQARDPLELPVSRESPLISHIPSHVSSPCHTSDNDDGREELMMSPAMLYEMAGDLELSPLGRMARAAEDRLGEISALPMLPCPAADARFAKAGLLNRPEPAVQSNAAPPVEISEATFRKHARWQESLRAALSNADGYTRALLAGATAYNPCGTVQVLAGLSPRQIAMLHAPARELVQSLLERTLELSSRWNPLWCSYPAVPQWTQR